MSRCIPFPPPGYVWNGVQGDALVELIKVRREKAEIEKRRKKLEKKKEKRERKLEGEFRKKKHSYHGGHRQHRSGDANKGSGYQARNEREFHGIERTSLAVELKQPSIADRLHHSFDRSQSAKRRRPERCHNQGNVVWIDIQLQERKDQKLLFSKQVFPITAMGFHVQEKSKFPHRCTKNQFCSARRESNSIKEQSFSTCIESTASTAMESDRPGVELSCPQTELVRDRKAGSALISQYSGSGLQHTELHFGESVVNWIPLPMKRQRPEFENLEWLYETKPRRQPPSGYTEIYSVSTDKSHHPVSSLYPTAQYLAQADTHALPFTIPF